MVPPMRKPVYIHAGAHRTGTSSFQLCLSENRPVLHRQGLDVVYPGRDGVPGGNLRLSLPRPRHGEKRVPEFAAGLRRVLQAQLSDRARGLILSEENIPGPMRHFYDGRFFPAAGKRFRSLGAALGAPPTRMIYVVRSYADLYLSAYRKRAEDNPVPDFTDLVPHFLAMDRGWPDLLAEMRDELRPSQLIVLAYEHRGDSRSLLRHLVPDLENVALSEPGTAMNLSATDAALIALQARYRTGQTLSRPAWQAVLKQYAPDTAQRGFAAFNTQDRAALHARYQQDLARLAEMPGISLMLPARPV
ncbi:hypothetical protein SAMN05216236_10781 [Sedimentitalea nanhaiensis]|uniref:Sulfotransferase family protein n=2 Tax=Sedimentitalea nanhaiensis TaxID=999627 RepID=A0A1I7ANF0_9RHOB|nr:hypothetical protein SAMN05216236_10781 [Sedimentitalea nanhaiensis]